MLPFEVAQTQSPVVEFLMKSFDEVHCRAPAISALTPSKVTSTLCPRQQRGFEKLQSFPLRGEKDSLKDGRTHLILGYRDGSVDNVLATQACGLEFKSPGDTQS